MESGVVISQRGTTASTSVFRSMACLVNVEHSIEHRDLQQGNHLLMHVGQSHFAAMLLHLSIGNEEGAEPATIAKVHFSQIDNKKFELWFAEKQKFPLQLGRDRRIEFLLFQGKSDRCCVFVGFKFHNQYSGLEFLQALHKAVVNEFSSYSRVVSDLKIVKEISMWTGKSNPYAGTRCFTNIARWEY